MRSGVMHYFGTLPRWAPRDMNLVHEFHELPAPVGRPCYYCPEPIKATDSGFISGSKIAHAHCYQLAYLGALQATGQQAN